MALGEFELIERYFSRPSSPRADVLLGVGDDCALLRVPADAELAVTMDTLVAGRHFPENTLPYHIGHKALAVNLSDLAAMGAEPAWVTLSLSLPAVDEDWIAEFARGLLSLAELHGVQLVGGDTVRGPLVITVQAHGLVPAGAALRRSGARPGDVVFVTGTLGDAGAGLRVCQGRLSLPDPEAMYLRARLERPEARVAQGVALRGIASACIDISDGLAADLGHVLVRSGVGATLRSADLPLSSALRNSMDTDEAQRLALSAGDDYELCFTVPPTRLDALGRSGISCTAIGHIDAEPGLRIVDAGGQPFALTQAGFDHFASA